MVAKAESNSAQSVLSAIRESGAPLKICFSSANQVGLTGLTIFHPCCNPPWVGIFTYATPGRIAFWLKSAGQ